MAPDQEGRLEVTKAPHLLIDAHDHLLLDLDGVVYHGPHAVPGAVEALARARAAGRSLTFVTNNAGRTPDQVAAHLVALGIEAVPGEVVTAAQAAATRLAALLPRGAAVFLAGGDGVRVALQEAGLRPVTTLAEQPVAVATGFGPDLPWQRIVDAGVLLREGLPWVASNADLTFPTGHGLGPGHGALVELLERFSGRRAEVAGKPEPALLHEALRRNGGDRPLMVGDRLDTDVAGARAAGIPSLLVLSGVTASDEVGDWPAERQPTYVGADLGALHLPPVPAPGPGRDPRRGEPSASAPGGTVSP